MDTFAKRLQWARNRKGLTQDKLALVTGMKQQMISKLENGEAKYTAKFMEIALVLDVSPGWLMTGVGPVEPEFHADKEFVEFMKIATNLSDRQRDMLTNLMLEMIRTGGVPTTLPSDRE